MNSKKETSAQRTARLEKKYNFKASGTISIEKVYVK